MLKIMLVSTTFLTFYFSNDIFVDIFIYRFMKIMCWALA